MKRQKSGRFSLAFSLVLLFGVSPASDAFHSSASFQRRGRSHCKRVSSEDYSYSLVQLREAPTNQQTQLSSGTNETVFRQEKSTDNVAIESDQGVVINGEKFVLEKEKPINGAQVTNGEEIPTSRRSLWRRRHARSIEEGIRRETTIQLSSLLKPQALSTSPSRKYFARIISGVIHALADEVTGLDVQIDARKETPIWNKHINAIRIDFSRLGFQPLRMGGLYDAIQKLENSMDGAKKEQVAENFELSTVSTMDEAFDRIDADNSGALDEEELAMALNMAAATDSDEQLLERLASELVSLYDINGDGVVDREEYEFMVQDMAALREKQQETQLQKLDEDSVSKKLNGVKESLGMFRQFRNACRSMMGKPQDVTETPEEETSAEAKTKLESAKGDELGLPGSGTIVFSDMKVDLRRLPFGAIPLVKTITPGGPLFLEPFTATMNGSFSKDDVMGSALLDLGLRRLVARALRRRVRSLRDIIDGAVFVGRTWNMASKMAPVVEVPKLTSVEFDKQDRLVMTGIARVQTSPDVPVIENAFKVRTRLGTRRNGRTIRLEQPELALVLECPKAWERNIVSACKKLGLPRPTRPEPIYSFFPIYSPFKLEDNDGFDLGPDNCIKSLYIKDGALRFELRAVLRPGRFLGSHYIAFSVPQRTFIITMDRVRAAMKAARKHKREMSQLKKEALKLKRSTVKDADNVMEVELPQPVKQEENNTFAQPIHTNEKKQTSKLQANKRKSFFTRFVEGYNVLGTQEEAQNARLTMAISDWFGRQRKSEGGDDSTTESAAKETEEP